jgi:hypothetical protein
MTRSASGRRLSYANPALTPTLRRRSPRGYPVVLFALAPPLAHGTSPARVATARLRNYVAAGRNANDNSTFLLLAGLIS